MNPPNPMGGDPSQRWMVPYSAVVAEIKKAGQYDAYSRMSSAQQAIVEEPHAQALYLAKQGNKSLLTAEGQSQLDTAWKTITDNPVLLVGAVALGWLLLRGSFR